jgi:hypothetical protein
MDRAGQPHECSLRCLGVWIRDFMPGSSRQKRIRLSNGQQVDQDELVRRVANRVWELWREDLRRERERRGTQRRS